MTARLEDGWVKVDFAGTDTDQCYIGAGVQPPDEWLPAYKAYADDGTRVLQVVAGEIPDELAGQLVGVWTRINGVVTRAAMLQL